MRSDLSKRHLDCCILLDDVARLLRLAADQNMRKLGLTQSGWLALMYVSRDEGMTQASLNKALQITRGGCTGLLNRLEKGGWLIRRDVEGDKRSNGLFLTPKTRHALGRLQIMAHGIHDVVFQDMSKLEIERFHTTLSRLYERGLELEALDPRTR